MVKQNFRFITFHYLGLRIDPQFLVETKLYAGPLSGGWLGSLVVSTTRWLVAWMSLAGKASCNQGLESNRGSVAQVACHGRNDFGDRNLQ